MWMLHSERLDLRVMGVLLRKTLYRLGKGLRHCKGIMQTLCGHGIPKTSLALSRFPIFRNSDSGSVQCARCPELLLLLPRAAAAAGSYLLKHHANQPQLVRVNGGVQRGVRPMVQTIGQLRRGVHRQRLRAEQLLHASGMRSMQSW